MTARVLVTGAAGFIGSHLVEKCASSGFNVSAIDSFLPNLYSAEIKRNNWKHLSSLPNVEFHQMDLGRDDISEVIKASDIIINCAAMPGLMPSWSEFATYLNCNVLALSRILEQLELNSSKRIIQISTSSVYGREAIGNENSSTSPISPYGVSKLAAENLIRVISEQKNLDFQILRLFSVYGPRQRPDMAYNIMIKRLLSGEELSVFGDGTASRSNTYVADVVDGIMGSISDGSRGEIYNICGDESYSLNSVISMLEELMGVTAKINYLDVRPGDQTSTKGDFTKANLAFSYHPKTKLRDGLTRQIDWQRNHQ